MQSFQSLHEYSQAVNRNQPVVITIGNFDGVHRGHQKVFQQLSQYADVINFQLNQSRRAFENLTEQVKPNTSNDVKSIVLTFQTPIDSFIKKEHKETISGPIQKEKLIAKYSRVDYFINIEVNDYLVDLTAHEFVVMLLKHMNIKLILIGDDFKFGKNRSGDYKSLCQFGEQLDFKVEQCSSLTLDSMRVSSTLIRKLLNNSEFDTASMYLGYKYEIEGEVVYGQQLARKWHVPTANIIMDVKKAALKGVYICAVIIDEKTYFGATNIGTRPTLESSKDDVWYCETHILDFMGDLYGKIIKVVPITKIRDENKFPTLEILRKRIYDDICTARTWLTYNI